MKGRILLIDDSPMDLKIATSVLEREGYACFGFTKHKEALAWAEQNTPQFIFLDLQMPDISGYQMIPLFQKMPLTLKAPIIIMSGKNQAKDVSQAVELGATDYLVKPIDALVLQEKISRLSATIEVEDFASVSVPEGQLETAKIIKRLKFMELSEFGAVVQTSKIIAPGETIELGGLPVTGFGVESLFARCLSSDESSTKGEFVIQLTFVGITESQRQTLRKYCRQIWIQSKKGAA